MASEDHCVYVKKTTKENLFLADSNLEIIEATKKCLSYVFEMKDTGDARHVLGV